MFSRRNSVSFLSLAAAALLAGCASKAPPPGPVKTASVVCTARPANDPLVGVWLNVRKEKGIVGEMYTLVTLKSDGTMEYGEQLKRGRQPPQGLSESGCWSRASQTLVLRSTQSNGVPVDLNDPIYINRYAIVSQAGKRLVLRGTDGTLAARRMPDGYRLPF
ncbi:MAG: hypothetical protein EPN46_04855 [Candidimonas sp.]|nr:MAG: hypothetical protein EPN77_13665 [Candidimonas sp.]TAM20919.1 MAG: hypothetical protein EPN62_15390 [Candidimonas sp.]TAM78152.1 MAG: hypothetical protein EPN46_04855 [Candidimonas sp.]